MLTKNSRLNVTTSVVEFAWFDGSVSVGSVQDASRITTPKKQQLCGLSGRKVLGEASRRSIPNWVKERRDSNDDRGSHLDRSPWASARAGQRSIRLMPPGKADIGVALRGKENIREINMSPSELGMLFRASPIGKLSDHAAGERHGIPRLARVVSFGNHGKKTHQAHYAKRKLVPHEKEM